MAVWSLKNKFWKLWAVLFEWGGSYYSYCPALKIGKTSSHLWRFYYTYIVVRIVVILCGSEFCALVCEFYNAYILVSWSIPLWHCQSLYTLLACVCTYHPKILASTRHIGFTFAMKIFIIIKGRSIANRLCSAKNAWFWQYFCPYKIILKHFYFSK